MSGDQEISVMGKVLDAMESLDSEARRRVFAWVAQRLQIDVVQAKVGTTGFQERASAFELSTDTIATILGASSGTDLIMAAAAQLHFVQSKPRFSRQELIGEMRTAPSHFKETFVNNLSKYLNGLTRADRLRRVAPDTFALSSRERQEIEGRLSDAA